MASKIFISYRRDDSAGTAGRLRDWLAGAFGDESLFMDVDNIPAGADFAKYLNDQVANCDIFLCTIGPNWLNARDDDGKRRLDQTDDYVRVEIAAALSRDISIIPVLIDGARVPKARELPDEIAPFTRRQAAEVRNSHFRRDADELTHKIEAILKAKRSAPSRVVLAVVGGTIAILVFGTIGLHQVGMLSLLWVHSGVNAPPAKEIALPAKPEPPSATQTGAAEPSHPAPKASETASKEVVPASNAPPPIPEASPATQGSAEGASNVAITTSPSSNAGPRKASQGSYKAVNVKFLNDTNQIVELYWVDFDGREVHYSSLSPHTSLTQATFTDHLWIAKTKQGVVLLKYVVKDT